MYESAILNINEFTRPIFSISRNFGSKIVTTKSATLFFVNELGYAITTMDTANNFLDGTCNTIFKRYKSERKQLGKSTNLLRELNKRYNYTNNTIVELKAMFIDCLNGPLNIDVVPHPTYNLALIRFLNNKNFQYQGFAKFVRNTEVLLQGKPLCRLGYPFQEFSNYYYNEELDEIDWKYDAPVGRITFPTEGIVTRLLNDTNKNIGIEMSTPGYEGHKGAPLFDKDGLIYGMHLANRHIPIETKKSNVVFQPTAFLGECINAEEIKAFLKSNSVKFYEVENGELIVNEGAEKAFDAPAGLIPTALIAGEGESSMVVYSTYMEIDGKAVVDYQTPLELTTGKVDPGSRKGGATSVQFSTAGDNNVFIAEQNAARTNHLDENRTYQLSVKKREFKSEKWKVRVNIKTQEKFPFKYFDLLLIRRHGQERDHLKDPHISFYPDGGGKYIRYDLEKGIQIDTTKIIESTNNIVLPKESVINADEFEIRLQYGFNANTLSIDDIALADK